MIVAQVALALVAALCVFTALTVIVPTARSYGERDARRAAAQIAGGCVFVLVLAAERGWYS